MELNVRSYFQSARRRSVPENNAKKSCSVSTVPSVFPKGYLAVVVIVVIITLQFSTPVRSASLNKRSTDQSEEVCRTNAICGWEVYHPSTRNLQYYVASSCKCTSKEICLKAEDDVSISAYVFRCRDPRRRKTTRRPSANGTS